METQAFGYIIMAFGIMLQDFSTIHFLSPVGQILLFLICVFFAFLTWRNRAWRSASEAASTALGALRSEMQTHKERADRLGEETRNLIAENATLKVKTDLAPVVDGFKAWTAESRSHFLQAMERLEQIHGEHSQGMALVTTNLAAINDAFRAQTAECSKRTGGSAR